MIGENTFRGRAPRYAAELLPAGMAQSAQNARLLSGNLGAWQDYVLSTALAKKGSPYTDAINTAFPMDIDQSSGGPFWLHWTDSELGTGAIEVDVARGPVVGDTTERIYLTGLDVPRVSNLALATDPSNQGANTEFAYPYVTYKLGVPAPTNAPTLNVTSTVADPSSVTLVNPSAESGTATGWTTDSGSLSVHTGTAGSPDPGQIDPQDGSYYFYGGTAATTEAHTTADLVLDTEGILPGQSITLGWYQASGSNGSTGKLGLRFYDDSATLLAEQFAADAAPGSTWTARETTMVVPTAATKVRIVIILTNGGTAGVDENDAYIDNITLDTQTYSYASDGSDITEWETSVNSGEQVVGTKVIETANDVFYFQADEHVTWARKNFQLETANYSLSTDFLAYSGPVTRDMMIGFSAGDSGACEGICISKTTIDHRSFADGNDRGTTESNLYTLPSGSFYNRWLTVTADVTLNSVGATVAITVTDRDAGTVLYTGSISIDVFGDYLYLRHWSNEGASGSAHYVDNTKVNVTAATTGDNTVTDSATNYVYTFVNLFGQESAPSPASSTIVRQDGATVEVTTDTTATAGYGVLYKKIYRAVTGDSGSVYELVNTEGNEDLATALYTDSKTDAQLGAVLASSNYDLPPTDGRGILATGNGVTYMFSGNSLCPSAQDAPHAYPEDYRLATDYPIVAICAIDTDVVVATQAHPYIATGDDPSALLMAKLEKPQGCVSKRSMVAIEGFGVVYASPDGLTAVSRGRCEVITKGYFSRKEWQALSPDTINAVAHDGRYYAFYDTGSTQAGFVFDPSPDGFGVIDLDFFATAAFSNPIDDTLYLVIDGALYAWDSDAAKRAYTWKSRQYPVSHPTCFGIADLRLLDGSVTMKLYADGSATPFFTKAVSASGEFNCPDTEIQDYLEVEFSGTGTLKSFALAEDVRELRR